MDTPCSDADCTGGMRTPPGACDASGVCLIPPEVRARLESLDLHYEGLAGAAAAKRLAELSERYGKVVRATGMKVE